MALRGQDGHGLNIGLTVPRILSISLSCTNWKLSPIKQEKLNTPALSSSASVAWSPILNGCNQFYHWSRRQSDHSEPMSYLLLFLGGSAVVIPAPLEKGPLVLTPLSQWPVAKKIFFATAIASSWDLASVQFALHFLPMTMPLKLTVRPPHCCTLLGKSRGILGSHTSIPAFRSNSVYCWTHLPVPLLGLRQNHQPYCLKKFLEHFRQWCGSICLHGWDQ